MPISPDPNICIHVYGVRSFICADDERSFEVTRTEALDTPQPRTISTP